MILGVDPRLQARRAVLIAAAGLVLFLAYVICIRALGWLEFPLRPVAAIFALLAALNYILARIPRPWVRAPWVAWAYEGFHAAVLTLVLHLFGGMALGIYLVVYGFLVVHTEILCPDASVFVTANICAACYGTLGLLEYLGVVGVRAVVEVPLSSGERWVFATFALVSFNFLALYANRHGSELRALALSLERMVSERTAELLRANAELATTAVALKKKQDDIQAFVYTVTHDVKNPLNGIVLTADRILEEKADVLDADVRAGLDRVMRTAERAEDMIRDLLGLFDITSAPEAPSWVDLDRVVRDAVDALGLRLRAKTVSIEIGPLPTIWGQEVKLAHVVANLLDNAVKYVPSGSGRVAVGATLDNGDAVLSVADNGIGIAPSYHRRIFEVFGRVPGPQQLVDGVAVGGSGVGLAIVKRIVEDQRGEVLVESQPGAGSVFRVRLPREPAA